MSSDDDDFDPDNMPSIFSALERRRGKRLAKTVAAPLVPPRTVPFPMPGRRPAQPPLPPAQQHAQDDDDDDDDEDEDEDDDEFDDDNDHDDDHDEGGGEGVASVEVYDPFAAASVSGVSYTGEEEEEAVLEDRRPRKTKRLSERMPFTLVRCGLDAIEAEQFLTTISAADFQTGGNQWRPLKWRKRGCLSQGVRTWRCPFFLESGCKARFLEVRDPCSGLSSFEQSGFNHNDHRGRQRCV